MLSRCVAQRAPCSLRAAVVKRGGAARRSFASHPTHTAPDRNAHTRVPPAFPALQPFFKVGHKVAVVLLVGVTVVTGFETVRALLTVRRNRLAWEKEHPEILHQLLQDAKDKKTLQLAEQREKYAVSAIDPKNDERRIAEAKALADTVHNRHQHPADVDAKFSKV